MSDDSLPILPWLTKEKLNIIAKEVYNEVKILQNTLGLTTQKLEDIYKMPEIKLNSYIEELRIIRKDLQEKDNHRKSQPIDSITEYIDQLENIYTSENRALSLEYFSTMGLHALNDAKEIKPNYPVGDDNEPTSTAPGGMADIECYYSNFNMICEVTMLNGRDQWFNEGQPVMRHLRDFEDRSDKDTYCIFIAPIIHRDTLNTFWISNKHEYQGRKQKIIPLTLNQYITTLKIAKNKILDSSLDHSSLNRLLDSIHSEVKNIENSMDWFSRVPTCIQNW